MVSFKSRERPSNFVVFSDRVGHEMLKTYCEIEKYCFCPKISRLQNRNYHALTLRKLLISAGSPVDPENPEKPGKPENSKIIKKPGF